MVAFFDEIDSGRSLELGDLISIKPPPGWQIQEDDFSVSGYLCSRILFRFCPPETDEVSLTFQLATLMHGNTERELFDRVVSKKGRPALHLVRSLYPRLINLAPSHVVDCVVIRHTGLGPLLRVDYMNPELPCKGSVLYAALDAEGDDFLVISYVSDVHYFHEYAKDARQCIKQAKRISCAPGDK